MNSGRKLAGIYFDIPTQPASQFCVVVSPDITTQWLYQGRIKYIAIHQKRQMLAWIKVMWPACNTCMRVRCVYTMYVHAFCSVYTELYIHQKSSASGAFLISHAMCWLCSKAAVQMSEVHINAISQCPLACSG